MHTLVVSDPGIEEVKVPYHLTPGYPSLPAQAYSNMLDEEVDEEALRRSTQFVSGTLSIPVHAYPSFLPDS